MKIKTKFGLEIAIITMLLVSSCDDNNKAIPETERVKRLLMTGTWQVTIVTADGVPTNVYEGLSVHFSATMMTASNGEPLWPASQTWAFTDETANAIQRGDGITIDILSISEAELRLGLSWDKTTFAGGRTESISGRHVFSFIH